VGNGVTAPVVLSQERAGVFEEARKAKYQGTVVLYIEVDPSGRAVNPRVVRSLGLGLTKKHGSRARNGSSSPATGRQTVTVAATIEVNFRLL